MYLVGAPEDQEEVAAVMADQHHDAHQPLVGQVREQDQERGQRVVQHVLIVVTLLPDEHVRNQSGRVLPQLEQVEYFHGAGCLGESGRPHELIVASPVAAQPPGEIVCVFDEVNSNY